ncbi:MAG TPA: ABC transporter permease [Stackebrandtia sp.]|jgi:peptide/nickel transport system permease protein|uniref:ABC transporter permease n=1 Tax=Stackebrandtia sp. TaxID=2023065 RepID=UPI002D56E1A3|nr:ABC transporter permease [Stackebrandtia sp.]HZE38122.1 ABC transporter permease [Stackebrandtia sp.]
MSTKTDKIDRLAELTAATSDDQKGAGIWREAFRGLRRSPLALTGAVIIAVFVVMAVIGPFVAPYDPVATTWGDEVSQSQNHFVGMRAENWLGLDQLGRDEFSRMLIGARQSLMVGVIATLLGFAVGAALGGISGACQGLGRKLGRTIDTVIMRFIDMMLALPSLLLAVSIAALLGRSLTTLMIAVGVVQIPIFARLFRGSMIAQSHSDYVLAARALGVRRSRIVFAHIVPNSLGPVIVQATLSLATAIIEAAALSFLGLGNPDMSQPEWGAMLAKGQTFISVAPQLALYPAVAIIITALGFTLLGEAMREALDPKLRK